jgi:hypothetical protein
MREGSTTARNNLKKKNYYYDELENRKINRI